MLLRPNQRFKPTALPSAGTQLNLGVMFLHALERRCIAKCQKPRIQLP